MQAATCRKILVSSRAAVGWLSVLAPNLIGRAWRMRSPLDKDVRFAVRLFGIRNVLLGYQLYQAERPDADTGELEEVIRQGIAVDTFDALFALFSRRGGRVAFSGSTIPFVASIVGAVLGILGRERAPDPQGPR